MLDKGDKIILAQLGKNARLSSQELRKILQVTGHTITDRGVRHRIKKLEKNNVILGYSAILNPNIISEKINLYCSIEIQVWKVITGKNQTIN